MQRRGFLTGLGAGAVASAAMLRSRPALAAGTPWGDYPEHALPGLLGPERRAKNVLDIFLYGGLCPWETFYVVPEYGTPSDPDHPNEQWWTFQSGPNGVPAVYARCAGDAAPPMLRDFLLDENGMMVQLGPFTEPLRSRPDIVERLRVSVLSHALEPHEGAIPLAMTGFRLGQPKLAGLGAAVQHYFQSRELVTTGEPYAYVLFSPGDFPTDNLRGASAVGFHPSSSRPLSIKVQANTAFIDALKRGSIASVQSEYDALLNHMTGRYRSRLVRPGGAGPTRAQTLSDYLFSLETLQKTGALVEVLPASLFTGVPGAACGDSASVNHPHMGLRLAAHLLTRPGTRARYVNVVDGGLISASGGGGYDTHNSHVVDSSRNLTNLWTQLVAIINAPGENDPGKLNLDETLVVINTEFGRTPRPQNGDGRNHHPYAYVSVMFGGPVAAPGIIGSIGPDGQAGSAMAPAQHRAAVLAAMGIYPFAPECYAVSDVDGAGTELEGCLLLNERLLGVPA